MTKMLLGQAKMAMGLREPKIEEMKCKSFE